MKISSLVLITFLLISCSEEKSNTSELEAAYNKGFRDGNQKAVTDFKTKFDPKYNKLRVESEKEIKELRSKLIKSRIHVSSTNLFPKDTIYNHLFSIKYYDGNDREKDRKNLSIVNKNIDTSYLFSGPIKYSPFYQEVEPYLKLTGIIKPSRNRPKIRNGFFSFSEAIQIDNNKMLGVFTEFFGFERIFYAYSILELKDNMYKFGPLFKNLDITGIGSFKYESVYKLTGNEFYVIAQNIGEEHHSIALHYFPADFNNKIYLLEYCAPTGGISHRDEKLVFDYSYENQIIKIDKLEIDPKKDTDWRIVFSKEYLLPDLIQELKSSNYYQLPRKRNLK
jgi:hypothetical protein